MVPQRQQSNERADLIVGPLRTYEVDGHACIGTVIVPPTPLAVHVTGVHVILPSASGDSDACLRAIALCFAKAVSASTLYISIAIIMLPSLTPSTNDAIRSLTSAYITTAQKHSLVRGADAVVRCTYCESGVT